VDGPGGRRRRRRLDGGRGRLRRHRRAREPILHHRHLRRPLNDCDGLWDEDFGYVDPSASLGDLTGVPETLTYAWLFPEGDEDVWVFYAEDLAFSLFDLEIALYDVPLHSDWALDLYRVDDASGGNPVLVDSADDLGEGGNELINYGGSNVLDNSSWYQVVVRGVGAQCSSPYTLQILVGTW